MIILLFLLFCLNHVSASDIVLQCQNEDDFYQLMYQICRQCILCRELYFIARPDETPINDYDFRKFKYQLSQIRLFNGSNAQNHYYNHNQTGVLFMTYVWPVAWVPTIEVQYNASFAQSCNASFNYTDVTNRVFLLIAVDLMKTYKEYISNEHYCPDYNERAVIDLMSGEFQCYCMDDKECNVTGNHRQFIFLLAIMAVGLFILVFTSAVIIAMRLFKND